MINPQELSSYAHRRVEEQRFASAAYELAQLATAREEKRSGGIVAHISRVWERLMSLGREGHTVDVRRGI